jgi:hypothetical protein
MGVWRKFFDLGCFDDPGGMGGPVWAACKVELERKGETEWEEEVFPSG